MPKVTEEYAVLVLLICKISGDLKPVRLAVLDLVLFRACMEKVIKSIFWGGAGGLCVWLEKVLANAKTDVFLAKAKNT